MWGIFVFRPILERDSKLQNNESLSILFELVQLGATWIFLSPIMDGNLHLIPILSPRFEQQDLP